MINVSNEFKKQLANDNRNYLEYADITLKDGTVLNLTNEHLWNGGLSVEDAVSSESSFDVGSAIINKGTLTINNIYDDFSDYVFEDAGVVVSVGLELSDGTIEKIRKGTYAVDEPSYNGSIITLSCLDNMRKFDRAYSESKLTYPATLNAIVRDACSVCGVTLQTVSFPHDDFIVQTRPTDEAVTFREVISWVAQIAGCFCRCDVYGRLELKWYDQTALENPKLIDWGAENPAVTENAHWLKSNYSAPVVSLDDVVITGVRVVEKNESEDTQEQLTTYQSGSDGYVISIENNELIKGGAGQTVAGWLGEQLIGIKFRKATVNHASDPTIEAGDIAVVTDRKGSNYNIVVSSTKFSAGSSQNTVSAAENPARNSAARYSAQTKNYVEWRKAIEKEKTEREKALEELGERLANSPGVFTTVETQSNGSKIYYLHNKPNLSESDMVWKMTAEAWGVSTDGGKTWNAGMTVDGDTIVRILNATGVSASWINTGVLRVADKDNNEIMYVDVDTGVVRINAQSLTIAGSPVASEQYVTDKLQSLNALNIILSNDYYSVPVDSDGNVPDGAFAGADTTVTVLWGTQDITNKVKIVISESASLSGEWNDNAKKYTASSLTADNGWADFSATYNGVSIVKRYTIVKRYPGADGKPGKSYQLGCSVNTVKKVAKWGLLPHYIDFESFYFAEDAKRNEYAGRFVVEESADGINWTRKYVSGNDEAFLRYHFYSPIGTASGKYLADAAGRFLAVKRISDNVMAVRCTLYAAGGTEDVIDRQTVSIITDADALSSEDYLDLLTDHGRIQGIFIRGDQLFINGECVQTKGLKAVDQAGNTTFYINDNGEVEINATSLSITGKQTATQEYADNTASNAAKNAVNAQTQKEIFDKLTNNSQKQGIFLDNGKIYLNFEFAQGQTLKLGGANNANGVLMIYNTSGEQIGKWDKDGIQVKNGTFAGQLSAATGTFSGELSGATGTFSGELKAGTVTGCSVVSELKEEGRVTLDKGEILVEEYTEPYIDTPWWTVGKMLPGTLTDVEIGTATYDLPALLFRFYNAFSIQSSNGTRLFEVIYTDNGEGTDRQKVVSRIPFEADSNLTVHGTKSRIVDTENYAGRLLYSYETPTPYFGDIGTGKINDNGCSYIGLDDIFSETVNSETEYCVFLQAEGPGELWVDTKESDYFIVKGTPGLIFAWELKAVQKGFENLRLDDMEIMQQDLNLPDSDFDFQIYDSDIYALLDAELEEHDKELEAIIYGNY